MGGGQGEALAHAGPRGPGSGLGTHPEVTEKLPEAPGGSQHGQLCVPEERPGGGQEVGVEVTEKTPWAVPHTFRQPQETPGPREPLSPWSGAAARQSGAGVMGKSDLCVPQPQFPPRPEGCVGGHCGSQRLLTHAASPGPQTRGPSSPAAVRAGFAADAAAGNGRHPRNPPETRCLPAKCHTALPGRDI